MRKVADLLSVPAEAGRNLYENLDKLLWLSVPAAIGGITWAGLKAMSPEAVAENADKIVLNEALKSSLAESIRKYERRQSDKALADAANSARKHDRFL